MRSKVRVTILVSLWLVPALIFALAFSYSWVNVWGSLGVFSMTPHFLDLRGFPSGLETMRQGGDALVANPGDPGNRPLNYPRIWLHLFSAVGLSDKGVTAVGLLFCALYLLSISWLILRSEKTGEALLLLAAGLSLAALFGMERGNTDQLIFFLVFVGCATAERRLRPVFFLAATLLKIFPFAAMLAETVRQRGKGRILAIGLSLLGVALLAWQWRDMLAIRRGTPIATQLSYGALTLRNYVDFLLVASGYSRRASTFGGWAIAVYCWVIGAVAFGRGWTKPRKLDGALLQSWKGEMFLIFGTIYAFSFAISSNWDYRLIFLIPTLPFAWELARDTRHSRWSVAYMACVLAAENLVRWGRSPVVPLSLVATLAVFVYVLSVLGEQARSYLGSAVGEEKTPQGNAG